MRRKRSPLAFVVTCACISVALVLSKNSGTPMRRAANAMEPAKGVVREENTQQAAEGAEAPRAAVEQAMEAFLAGDPAAFQAVARLPQEGSAQQLFRSNLLFSGPLDEAGQSLLAAVSEGFDYEIAQIQQDAGQAAATVSFTHRDLSGVLDVFWREAKKQEKQGVLKDSTQVLAHMIGQADAAVTTETLQVKLTCGAQEKWYVEADALFLNALYGGLFTRALDKLE